MTEELTRSTKTAAVFVWSVWSLMVGAALWFVQAYGSSLPYTDDWEYIPFVTGARPVTWDWLWEQVAQHRQVLTKAATVGLIELGRGDFFFVLVCNALILAALAWAMIRAAARLRGRASFADAFFPLLWLNWGLARHLLYASNFLFYGVVTIVASLLLLLVTRSGRGPTPSSAVLSGLCLVLLPLAGSAGVLYTPALAVWLGLCCVALLGSRDAPARRGGAIGLALIATTVVVLTLYFVGFAPSRYGTAATPSVSGKLSVGLSFLGSGLGFDSRHWLYSGLVVLVIALVCGGALIRSLVRERGPERIRTAGLLLFLAATACLTVGIGLGREAIGADWTYSYRELALPVLCCLYYVGVSERGRLGRIVQVGLALLLTLASAASIPGGIEIGRWMTAQLGAFERDVREGVPEYVLVAKHKESILYWGTHDDLAGYLRMVRHAGLGPFARMQSDPPFEELHLSAEPRASSGVHWTDGTARGEGSGAYLEFELPRSMQVAGIRFTATHSNYRNATLRLTYDGGRSSNGAMEHWLRAWPGLCQLGGPIGGAAQSFTVYLADTARAFRVYPDDAPFEFRVSEIVLLVPRAP